MRTIAITMLALIVGFFAGIVLSEIIGVVGFLLFDSIVGFKFLPLVSAFAAAGTAVVVSLRARRRAARPSPPKQAPADHEAMRHDPRGA